jgi:hypothetical protein
MFMSCSESHEHAALPIKAKWYTITPEVSYLSLDFKDSTVFFDNRGDTVMTFKYSVDNDTRTLHLTDVLNQKTSSKILKIDSDSLILDRLWGLNTIQRFYKNKTD